MPACLAPCSLLSLTRPPIPLPASLAPPFPTTTHKHHPTTAKECGLHSGNIKKADGTTEERKADRDLWSEASAVAALDKAAVEKLAGGARDKDTLLVLYAPWCPFCQVGSSSS